MKKKISIIFMTILIILLTCGTVCTTEVQAALQSNPNTHYKKKDTPTNWMSALRNMEVTGGALGLTETIDRTTKIATSESNNLDSHMMKSTEYGAIAILSASGYGNPKILQSSTIKSTTGNVTGVYFNTGSGNDESVAGGFSGHAFTEVDGRYYNAYSESNNSAKAGDAMGTASTTNKGCAGWHSAKHMNKWASADAKCCVRNYYTGLFSFYFEKSTVGNYCRGVVICGYGL